MLIFMFGKNIYPIFISHSCFPHLFPILGSFGRMNLHFSPMCFPYLSPTLGSVGCMGQGGLQMQGCRNDILYRKLKYNWDFLHLFGVSAGIIEPRRSTVNTKLASTEMQSFALGVVCWVNYCHYNESDILVLIPHIFSAHRNSVNYPQFNLDSLSYCKGRTLSLSLTISARHV